MTGSPSSPGAFHDLAASLVVDAARKRREEGVEQLLRLFFKVARSCPVRSTKCWDYPERLVARLQILGRVLAVVVVRQEVILVLSLLLSNGIMVLLRRSFCYLF
ncbi:hypothetical protein COCMIDRAFT_10375 [Bipolaris oryzae ATCC 44560]|uniref:Uncharacterized protein n=1 Tax=Bipolaris oryzae ATCC 44560 TaxID=930090 RepID=W6YJI6_COCMI|nr:uncharacterized protein COCMIDRAFT_10375 [Bipolaris oryzae ATCC 44560]EUC39532.1 hypothetical protein COCMIDRAFT_10375 [Bipolaris oryzae ATCC 44560]